jgi:hypothetical protein
MDKIRKRRPRRVPGNFISIPDGNGGHYFGRELREGVVAFYDLRSSKILSLDLIANTPILFKLPVMNYAFKPGIGKWQYIGHSPLEPSLTAPVEFFMQDSLTGEFSLYKEGGLIVPATADQIVGLECTAVWNPEHVEDRLRDHYDGVPNIWFESLKPKFN